MSIISLDGELEFARYNRTSQIVHISHKTTKALIHLGPRSLGDKWRTPNHGFYVPTDVNLVITPHISENAGVTAVVKLIDDSDMSPNRVLYQSKEFNLGMGLTLEGSQLPFCLPVGEYPIVFEVTVLRSQFQATRTMFTTSLEWRMMWSSTPLSRANSVFAVAHEPVADERSIKNMKVSGNNLSGPRARKTHVTGRRANQTDGGTTLGLVTKDCVGSG
jgi:hypothetical protein